MLEALADYHARNRYGFAPPGHRQGRGVDEAVLRVLGREPFLGDVLSSGGLDDRSSSHGYLSQAEKLMAQAVGAEQAFFSTCGSSLSVKAAMLAVAGGRGELLVSRDAHKSVVAGLIFAGVEPRWIKPRYDSQLHLAHPPGPDDVEAAWVAHPDAAGALIVSPTPYGTCADLESIVEICHSRRKPLIVDEAWGAHLPFFDQLPTWAMDAGADVCVVSVHKMGMGFEQGSVFHVQGDLVDPDHLSACADLLMTTSPNVLIYAAIDGWRRQMVREGEARLTETLRLADDVRERIEQRDGLHVLHDELLTEQASHDLDRLHVLIDVSDLGITGYQVSDWIREHRAVDLGLSDHRRVEVTISMGDDEHMIERLLDALDAVIEAAPGLERAPSVAMPSLDDLDIEPVLLPAEAFFGPYEDVAADQAVGRVAAEQITPYPPGIPALVPGERITAGIVDYLRSGLAAGMVLPDATDSDLNTIRVVALP
ncbi:MAG: ornithine decarboxylase [Actinobacteria bacterium]|nr:ornithine decarboxylase [Actinomycetota bacterium]